MSSEEADAKRLRRRQRQQAAPQEREGVKDELTTVGANIGGGGKEGRRRSIFRRSVNTPESRSFMSTLPFAAGDVGDGGSHCQAGAVETKWRRGNTRIGQIAWVKIQAKIRRNVLRKGAVRKTCYHRFKRQNSFTEGAGGAHCPFADNPQAKFAP